jgi:mannose-6-phosphate isomerase-like protein (cupin superfamily)
MTAQGPQRLSIGETIARLTFLPDRTPDLLDEAATGAFVRLAEYRDGGIFVGHWAGESEWERHPVGDEIVMVVNGETTITFLTETGDESLRLRAGELVVVPQGTWHRFHTPEAVEVMSVTPQPTEHRADRPD